MSLETADCAGAILRRGDRLLLGRRTADRPRFPGCWDVLGGRLRPGEGFAEALVREVEEEAGIVPTAYRVLYRSPIPEGGELALFLVTAWSGGQPRLRGAEHDELRWFRAEEAARLPTLVAPELARLLRSLARSGP